MNKKDFLSTLDDKLFYLVDNARNSEISKYESVIDSYVNMGQTEEAAVQGLGNIDDLVTAIYLSHGLDYKKLTTGNLSIGGIKGAFRNFYLITSGKDKKKARNAILYLLYLILLVILLKIVFIFVRDMCSELFTDITSNNTFYKIYGITFEVLYIAIAVIVFFKMFTKRFK